MGCEICMLGESLCLLYISKCNIYTCINAAIWIVSYVNNYIYILYVCILYITTYVGKRYVYEKSHEPASR